MKNNIPDKAKIDLHIHPYFEEYKMKHLLRVSEKKGINIMGLIKYNDDIFPELHREAKRLPKNKYDTRADNGTCIKIYNKKTKTTTYLLKTIEMMTGEKNGNKSFHIIGVGDTKGLQLRKEEPFPRTEKCIETILKNDGIAIIDHPYSNASYAFKSITKEKEKELERLCKEFKGDLSLEWNSYCLPYLRFPLEIISSLACDNLTGYHSNRNTEKLAGRLEEYGTRIVADSDVHARNKKLLDGLGSGHIEIFKERMNYSDGKNILKSVKNAIKIGEGYGYKNVKEYVSLPHFIGAFGIPYIFNAKRNRG